MVVYYKRFNTEIEAVNVAARLTPAFISKARQNKPAFGYKSGYIVHTKNRVKDWKHISVNL